MRLHIWSETNGVNYFTFNGLTLYYEMSANSFQSYTLTPIASYNTNTTECKFTVTGRDEIVTITCPKKTKAGTFYVKSVISTSTTNNASNTFAFDKVTGDDNTEKGFYIDFPDTLKVDRIRLNVFNVNYGMYDVFLQIDNFKTPIQKVDNGTGTAANNFTLSAKAWKPVININTKVKGIRGRDGKLYFLKPKDKANG